MKPPRPPEVFYHKRFREHVEDALRSLIISLERRNPYHASQHLASIAHIAGMLTTPGRHRAAVRVFARLTPRLDRARRELVAERHPLSRTASMLLFALRRFAAVPPEPPPVRRGVRSGPVRSGPTRAVRRPRVDRLLS